MKLKQLKLNQLFTINTAAPFSPTAAGVKSCDTGTPAVQALQVYSGPSLDVVATDFNWTSPDLPLGNYTVMMYSTLAPPRAADDNGCNAIFKPSINGVASNIAAICDDDEGQEQSLNYPTFIFKSVPVVAGTPKLFLNIPSINHFSGVTFAKIKQLSIVVIRE